MTDVKLFQTPDDGDINIENGVVELTRTKETAVYLSLFGGNPEDDGSEGNRQQWWGNDSVVDPDATMTSRTQNLLNGIPATSGNLKRIVDAVRADLEWLGDEVQEVSAQLTGVKRIRIVIDLFSETLIFNEDWTA